MRLVFSKIENTYERETWRDRERQRETESDTERQRDRERERKRVVVFVKMNLVSLFLVHISRNGSGVTDMLDTPTKS